MRVKRAFARGQMDPTGRVARCGWREDGPTVCGAAVVDTCRLGWLAALSSAGGLSARLAASDGPNWAFLGLNFWVFLGKLAQIQLFSSKT